MSRPFYIPISHLKTTRTIFLLLLSAATSSVGVHALLEWTWSYEGDNFTAAGTLHTTKTTDIEGYYTIKAITGQRNGVEIVELTDIGVPVPGNAIREATDSDPGQLRSAGIGVRLEDGTYLNPFYASWRDPPTYLEIYSAEPFIVGFNNSGPEDHELPINFTATIVPPVPTMEWTWSYEGVDISASGSLHTETTADDEGFYTITSINGDRNGVAITELTEIGIPVPGVSLFEFDLELSCLLFIDIGAQTLLSSMLF